MVHELGEVRVEAVALAAKFALEYSLVDRIAFVAFEDKHDESGAPRNLLLVLRELAQLDLVTGDYANGPLVRLELEWCYQRQVLHQSLSDLGREHLRHRDIVGPVHEAAAVRQRDRTVQLESLGWALKFRDFLSLGDDISSQLAILQVCYKLVNVLVHLQDL